MARYARIHVTGGLFHVISRFHDRRFYLDIEGAREKYLEYLGGALKSHDARIVAYCLMSSHVHLVIQLGCDSIGKLAKKVNSPFGNWVNEQRESFGAVFADRPKSVLVHDETYGMELIRYVHNNPVRAGIVERAVESGWSSHRAYMGLEPAPKWLATDAVFGPDVKKHEEIRHDLSCFVDEGRQEQRRPEFSGEVSRELRRRIRKLMGGEVELSYPVLGPDSFVTSSIKKQVKHCAKSSVRESTEIGAEGVVRAVFTGLSLEPQRAVQRIKSRQVARGRALSAWLWAERLGRPPAEIAEAMRLCANTVSKMLTKLRVEGLSSEEASFLDEIMNALSEESETETSLKSTSEAAHSLVVKRMKRGNK